LKIINILGRELEFWGYQNFGICIFGPDYLENRGNKTMSMEKTSKRSHCPLSAPAGQGQQLSLFNEG